MFKLDNDFLISLGLGGLPVDEKNRLLQVIYERLEMNVGMRLAEKMNDQQLDEFEGFIDRNDEAGALRWLETNFPNYKDVVAEELEKLKKEVGASAPQILAAAQAAAPQTQSAPGAQQVQPPIPRPFEQPPTQPQPAWQPQGGQQGPAQSAYDQNPYQQQSQPSGGGDPMQPGQPAWQPPTAPSPQPYAPQPIAPAPQQPFAPAPFPPYSNQPPAPTGGEPVLPPPPAAPQQPPTVPNQPPAAPMPPQADPNQPPVRPAQ